MEILKYNLCTIINHGTEEEPKIEEILSPVTMTWNEANEEIAKAEAYNGEYEIIDDGVEETPTPTQLDILDARLTYVEMMSGILEV
jgi:hypothetical protein